MNFKKRVNGSWTNTPHYIHNTSTDTITTLPADLYADGNNATVGLKGNMSQTGTPSPTTPIQPQECGERTGNLFDKSVISLNAYPATNNTLSTSPNTKTAYMQCMPNTTYTISKIASKRFIVAYTKTVPAIGETFYDAITDNEATKITITTGNDASYLIIFYYHASYDILTENEIKNSIMVNTGSTALPYEPYGYKIPILSANTTTPVYLGEVQSTRRISKFILTGQEEWGQTSNYCFFLTKAQGVPENYYSAQEITIVCSHFQPVSNRTSTQYVGDGAICFYYYSGTSTARELYIRYNDLTTVTDFKTYLAQQYAAGTPVTVWYVLATPTTGIVNEPIRKIGEYADSISNITIPTISGADTLSIGTTLQPSEVTVNYHGWHPVADVHERDNGAWT